jgi:DNA topoisomerase-1
VSIRTLTGDCIVHASGRRDRTQRGRVHVLIKPDDTVLVHDADGYQPVAWLTRPAELSVTTDPLWVVATDGDESLQIEAAGEDDGDLALRDHDVSRAGIPVGDCRCGGHLVRAVGEVVCLDCEAVFGLPSGASVTDETCDCGLPKFRADRGETFELCLDYDCGSLTDAVTERFDREWDCPECGSALEVLRRGGLIAGCAAYPDCETGFSIPDGCIVEECDCGLPVFETASGRRCLDATCGT